MKSTAVGDIPPLVSAAWLAARLGQGEVIVVDASWYLPSADRDADTEYRAAHVPGAVRLDWTAVSDDVSDLPHMLPPPGRFASAMESLGIGPEHHVIVYDGSGVNLSAARAWWMYRVFGHAAVSVLDGGFQAWAKETRPVQVGVTRRAVTGYAIPQIDTALVRDRSGIERIIRGDDSAQLADCRPTARFRGEAPEPREGLRMGNIDGSVNMPFTDFTDATTHRFLAPAALRGAFMGRGLDPTRPIVASCGSGMSACTLALAVEVLRHAGDPIGAPVAIYDGSWAEYGKL